MRISYRIKDDKHNTTVIVSSRPKTLSHGVGEREKMTAKERREERADAYMSVTDTFCTAPKDKPFVWLPWNEGRYPYPELYYSANRALIWWIHYQKLKRVILFCDGGSHRSVTIFGVFLLTYFPEQAEKIVQERTSLTHGKLIEDHWANPLQYARRYLDQFPADRLLLASMGKDYLSRFDNHSKGIYEMVKERYGDHK